MNIELKQKVSLNKEVLMQDLGGESVFLDCESESYFGLDEVGTRMLSVLQESPSIQVASERLLEEYEVEPQKLQADLLELVKQLVEEGIVEVTNP